MSFSSRLVDFASAVASDIKAAFTQLIRRDQTNLDELYDYHLGTGTTIPINTPQYGPGKLPLENLDLWMSDKGSHASNRFNPHQTTAAQVGADPEGAAVNAIAAHVANPDYTNPHTQYLLAPFGSTLQVVGVDLNTLVKTGFYRGDNLKNAPATVGSGWAHIAVYAHDAPWVMQTAMTFGAGNAGGHLSTRVCVAGTWSPWKLVVQGDQAGNLGLGVETNAWPVTSRAVQLPGGAITSDLWSVKTVRNAYLDVAGNWRYIADGVASLSLQSDDGHLMYMAPAGSAGALIAFVEQARVAHETVTAPLITANTSVRAGDTVVGLRMATTDAPASYQLFTLPASWAGSFDHVRLRGVYGTWIAGSQRAFDLIFSARDGFTAQFIEGPDGLNIEVYQQTDGSIIGYVSMYVYQTFCVDLTGIGYSPVRDLVAVEKSGTPIWVSNGKQPTKTLGSLRTYGNLMVGYGVSSWNTDLSVVQIGHYAGVYSGGGDCGIMNGASYAPDGTFRRKSSHAPTWLQQADGTTRFYAGPPGGSENDAFTFVQVACITPGGLMQANRFADDKGLQGVLELNAKSHFSQVNSGTAATPSIGWLSAAFGDASGDRLAMGQYGGKSYLVGHTGDLNGWSPCRYRGASHEFYAYDQAGLAAIIGPSGDLYAPLIKVGQFTLSTLPSATAWTGYHIDVVDAAGGPKTCRSDGANWCILNTTTQVS